MSGGARVAVTPQNDVIVAGAFCGTLDVGDGPIASQGSNTSNGFIAKLQGKDGSGKTSDGGWLTTFGDGSNSQGISDVAVALTGEIVVGGEFKGSLDQGGVRRLEQTFRGITATCWRSGRGRREQSQ